MTWIKKYWDSDDAYLEHSIKKYAIPSYRFTEGISSIFSDRTWFFHLSEKKWITYSDLYDLKEIFNRQHPEVDWDFYFNEALKVNPKSQI